MPNTEETLKALISAFNVNSCARRIVETNFVMQRRNKKDYIVVSFDKDMGEYQCSKGASAENALQMAAKMAATKMESVTVAIIGGGRGMCI